jgi:hypothetical protein
MDISTALKARAQHARDRHHPGDLEVFQAMLHLLNRTPLAPDPYLKTSRNGHTLDYLTHYALLTVEHRLGYRPGALDVLQGSYNGGTGEVDASGNTHDGGGAVDLTAQDWPVKVHALRAIGFAAWHRPAIPGLWGEHVHAVLIGNSKLSPAAQAQVADYLAHRNGLADHRPDPSWHPDPPVRFTMPHYRMEN